jgi:hypothetical protein
MGSKKRCESSKEEKPKKEKYKCKKCGLTSAKEKQLCKPKEK